MPVTWSDDKLILLWPRSGFELTTFRTPWLQTWSRCPTPLTTRPRGLISVDFASNQSGVFEVFFQKVARAVRCMVSRKSSHFSVAESLGCEAPNSLSKAYLNCDMRFGCDIMLTSIRGFPCFLVRWDLFGC